MINPGFALRLAFYLLICATTINDAFAAARVTPQSSGVEVRLRGVSVVDGDVAWASGQNGTVLRTRDGGKRWETRPVPDAEALDFRDIEAFDADTAVILAIGPGPASRIYRTEDGGATWTLALQNRDPRAFFDCMAFEGERGWMLGDPVDGRFQLYATHDAGRSWNSTGDGPVAAVGDAAFAASGTCIARAHGALAVATGGAHPSLRVRRDGEIDWQVLPMAMGSISESAGVFSAAGMAGTEAFIAVGGDYHAESTSAPAATISTTTVLGHAMADREIRPEPFGWTTSVLPPNRGYRSGIACNGASRESCIAVGPSGVDLLLGRTWQPVSDVGYDAIALRGNTGWAVGNEGRIARIDIDP